MCTIALQAGDARSAARALSDAAIARGSEDNVSVVVVDLRRARVCVCVCARARSWDPGFCLLVACRLWVRALVACRPGRGCRARRPGGMQGTSRCGY